MTALNFKAFRDFHIATNYDLTICGQPYEVQIPFGYPIITGDVVSDFQEKPMFVHLVNAGIYCIMPEMIDEIPTNARFDMPDLIKKIIGSGKRVGVFPLRERLHEIGRHRSYVAAEEFYKNHLMPQCLEADARETA
jgi:NDP-sugar pyrophosphorylase family protein